MARGSRGRANRLLLPVELSNGGVLSGLWKAAIGGRVEGVLTGIAKLRLPLPLFETLKKVAEEMDSTMSSVVADSLRARFVLGRGARGAGGRREAAAEKTT